jgi:Polysaccharide pyruvyl transferase
LTGFCEPISTGSKRALLVGAFSTVGDLECLEYVKQFLNEKDCAFDIAPFGSRVRSAISGAIAPSDAIPERYSHLFIICGPCWPEPLKKKGIILDRYAHCVRIGVNLTMLKSISEWNPFHALFERDSDAASRPDLTFLMAEKSVPVLGRCVIPRQNEYRDRQRHDQALAAIDGLISRHQLPVIDIDTRWPNAFNVSESSACDGVSALMRRTDVLVTNRLHGLVFAIKNGVPVIAIDAVAGGDKLSAQARSIEWPVCLEAENATPDAMDAALKWCLTSDAREAAQKARAHAVQRLEGMKRDLSEAFYLQPPPKNEPSESNRSLWRSFLRAMEPYRGHIR